ncbi:M28 family metallopeptidase [Halobacterium sp. CBA1126]|uniref:M28 family metallopeptidase n=1 Tax=Halobacterium sp. CBA1126 TaxID=2668074 RepID=UPI0012FA7ADC|nr:M28 family metallopeptidase [Halobacterium sp. CBA1126]MUV61105.1 M28 family peptidase [Halobacterium sp. CBA1126]
MTEDAADAALGRAWRDDTPWRVLTALTEGDDRLAGHEGEAAAAELAGRAFLDAGARDARVETFALPVWTRGDCSLAVTDPVEREFPAFALPYSPAGEIADAPLVDAGHGTEGDFAEVDAEGAVVLASTDSPAGGRLVHRMEKYGYAVDGTAAGFVFYNHRDGQLPPTGALRFGREGEIPAAGVSKETGAWLREYADRGGRVAFAVDASTERGTGTNAHAVLGPDTDEEVLALAHHDAHDVAEGALDNGCGVATLVAAARVLADLDLDCRVRVATVGAEEVGLLGSAALADAVDLDAVRAVVNVDGAGRYRTLRAFTHGTDAFAGVLEDVSERANRPIEVEETLHPYSDHWPFLRRGVPAVQLHSVTPERGRGWGHTPADTRDKADSRNLREHGALAALLVQTLTRRTVPRPEDDELRETLADAGMRPGMEAADVWPADWD